MSAIKLNAKCLLGFILVWPILASAQDTASKSHHYEFSIKQVIDYAKKNNAQIKNALVDVKLQEQVNKEVTANAYPRIGGVISTTYNPNVATQVIPNFISPATYGVLIQEGVKNGSGNTITMPGDFGTIAAQFGTKFSANTGITLQQLLFDGQVFVGLETRSTILDWKRKNVELTEEIIKANIYKIYYQLVVSKKQMQLLDANTERMLKLLHDTKLIYENGFAEKLDVDKVSVGINNLQAEKTKVQNAINNGFYGLKYLIGMPMPDELVLTDTVSYDQIRDGMLEAGSYQPEDRKELQYALLGKKLNEQNVRRYKLSQIPTVALSGNYLKNAQRNTFDFLSGGKWYTISSVGLNVSIPIFNGYATRAKIEGAQLDLQKTNNLIENLKLNIDQEVNTARNNFTSAIASLDFQKKNMELAETVFWQTKKKYEMGTGSQTEITSAELSLKTAQTNYISAMYDAIIARVDFLKATGKLQ